MKKLLRGFDISETFDNYNDCSGGEKQKISIINSFLKDPDVLILDEPTSALDKKSVSFLIDELLEIKREK